MSENEMGNRGSKSVICKSITVKEQRVDGSYIDSNLRSKNTLMNNSMLRCTLTGFERSYPVKILSNQIRTYSANNNSQKPKFIDSIDP